VPECVRPPVVEGQDLDSLPVPDSLTAPRMRDRVDGVRLMRERGGDDYSVLGWIEGPAAEAADLRGVSEFLMDMMEEPEWCGELMDRCVDAGIAFAQAQVDAGADTIGIGDAICSQISPDLYEEMVLPRQKRLFAAVRDAGARIRLHICGQTRHLWNGYGQLPLDLVDVDHLVGMREIREALGPEPVLVGNLDPTAHMRYGDPEKIGAGLAAARAAAGERWMASAGCEIPSGTPVENLQALCEPMT